MNKTNEPVVNETLTTEQCDEVGLSATNDLLDCADCTHQTVERHDEGDVYWCDEAKGKMLPETCYMARETFCGKTAKYFEAN